MVEVLKDPYGAIRNGTAKGIRKTSLPLGTVVRRSDVVNGRRKEVRYVKVRMSGPAGKRWVLYARWWWEKHRGPVPPGKLVIHLDGDELNDDPSNFALGTPGTKFKLAHQRDPGMSKDNRICIATKLGIYNRVRAKEDRKRKFQAEYWYPVVDALGIILNTPFRHRRRLCGVYGADLSKYPANGHGPAVRRAISESRVHPVQGFMLSLPCYRTYAVADPDTRQFRGPLSAPSEQLVAQLTRMEIWPRAERAARRDARDRR